MKGSEISEKQWQMCPAKAEGGLQKTSVERIRSFHNAIGLNSLWGGAKMKKEGGDNVSWCPCVHVRNHKVQDTKEQDAETKSFRVAGAHGGPRVANCMERPMGETRRSQRDRR